MFVVYINFLWQVETFNILFLTTFFHLNDLYILKNFHFIVHNARNTIRLHLGRLLFSMIRSLCCSLSVMPEQTFKVTCSFTILTAENTYRVQWLTLFCRPLKNTPISSEFEITFELYFLINFDKILFSLYYFSTRTLSIPPLSKPIVLLCWIFKTIFII